jgi:simple sugar transport system permease protein
MIEGLGLFADATVRVATPLLFAALGETVAERAGVINLGIEGALIAGAFGALVGSTQFGVAGGLVAGVVCGAVIGAVFAALVIGIRTDQIIAGTAISMLALGATGTLYRALYGVKGASLSIATLHAEPLGPLASIPVIGRALFAQPITTYALYILVPLTWWWMYRTHGGLALRACGEAPEAARAAGVRVRAVQAYALLFAGALGGAGGSVLVLAQAGTFAEGMSAGRGFVAIAIVVLGKWHPVSVAAAAILFGAAGALQTLFQSLGSTLPSQLFLALPYAFTLLALAGIGSRSRAPAQLGATTP